ncbi:hypothetical protein HDV00_012436 [Rhizophlyctis rosea]|nr:hypothetical protein HDV00_012436 [Rhizophlyctis rosea]
MAARMFVDATHNTGRPLLLRSLKLYGIGTYGGETMAISCYLLQFMRLLQTSLRDLVLETSFHSKIPADIRFNFLESLRITPYVRFRDWGVSMPNLKSVKIFREELTCEEVPKLRGLTQRSLTSFSWRGPWPGVLSTLPNINAQYLTSLSIDIHEMGSIRHEQILTKHFSLVFPYLTNLTSLRINESELSNNCFGCWHLLSVLARIPSTKRKIFRMMVQDWKLDYVRNGLALKECLEEVVLYARLDEGDWEGVRGLGEKVRIQNRWRVREGSPRRSRCSRQENDDSEIDSDDDE